MNFKSFFLKRSPILNSFFLTMAVACLGLGSMSAKADQLEGTGYVRVEKIDGVWWFISPDGEKFVSNGVNHIEPHLWLAPYNKEQTLRRYGKDMVDARGHFNTSGSAARKWIDQQVKHARGLNFNTFAKHTHDSIDPKLYKDQIYYVASLETGPLAGWRERNGEGPRPDVFSVDFGNFLEQRISESTKEHRESRNLLGYLYTDVPSWVMGRADQKARNVGVMIYPWINAIVALGESSPGKWKWIEHLQGRYEDAEEVAEVWGLPISPTYGISWRKIARLSEWRNVKDEKRASEDLRTFMEVIADQWYGLHREILLKHDPNHLLFGDKNLLNQHHDWLIPALRKHVDVVCVQAYGKWALDGKITAAIYEQLGKPIFNGDGCFGFTLPEQVTHGVKGFSTNAKSLKEVASLYRENLTGMMSAPYMVGWHHCGYIQQWDAAERGDSPRNENGFLDPFENLVTEWSDVIREVNGRAADMHEAARKQ